MPRLLALAVAALLSLHPCHRDVSPTPGPAPPATLQPGNFIDRATRIADHRQVEPPLVASGTIVT